MSALPKFHVGELSSVDKRVNYRRIVRSQYNIAFFCFLRLLVWRQICRQGFRNRHRVDVQTYRTEGKRDVKHELDLEGCQTRVDGTERIAASTRVSKAFTSQSESASVEVVVIVLQ